MHILDGCYLILEWSHHLRSHHSTVSAAHRLNMAIKPIQVLILFAILLSLFDYLSTASCDDLKM